MWTMSWEQQSAHVHICLTTNNRTQTLVNILYVNTHTLHCNVLYVDTLDSSTWVGHTVWPEILQGIFWKIGGFRAICQYFTITNLHSHHYRKIIAFMYTKPAARRVSLILGMKTSLLQRVLYTEGGRRVGLSVNARKAIQTTCMRSLKRPTQRKQSRLRSCFV